MADPATMIDQPGVILIDEYQRAPVVLDAIKAQLNTSGLPGQFVLTGSTRHESLPRAAQALTGRLARLPILPLAQCEIDGTHPRLLHRLFADHGAVLRHAPSTTTRADYVARTVRGGFPMALTSQSTGARSRWIDYYVRLTLERDVQELSRLRQAHILPQVLNRLAGRTAQILNTAALCESLDINKSAAGDYVRLLEAVFLVAMLPAWDRTLTKRTTVRPKVHMIDTGVGARLLRLGEDKLARRDAASMTEFGHLFETFVVNEILKEASWTEEVIAYGHWRTRDDVEVDLVLESEDGGVVAFEIKTAARVSGADYRGLRALRNALGDSFVAGVVLYSGERGYTYDDRLYALPADRLWVE
jgi:predicted AAA+ superfamily ATPase